MRCYLAGPMRTRRFFNAPAFREGAAKLRAQGHEVFSPVENTEARYGAHVFESEEGDEAKAGVDGRLVFGDDLAWICAHADAVVLLPGWGSSRGATAERAVALALGLAIWELE